MEKFAPIQEGEAEDRDCAAGMVALVEERGVVSLTRIRLCLGIHRNAVHYHLERLLRSRSVCRLVVGRDVLVHHPRLTASTALLVWSLRRSPFRTLLEHLHEAQSAHLSELAKNSGMDRFVARRFLAHLCRFGLVEAPVEPQRPYRAVGLGPCLRVARIEMDRCRDQTKTNNPSGCAQEGV